MSGNQQISAARVATGLRTDGSIPSGRERPRQRRGLPAHDDREAEEDAHRPAYLDDPVCVELLYVTALLLTIEANDLSSIDDLATLAAIVAQAEAIIGKAHAIKWHALADLGATLRTPQAG